MELGQPPYYPDTVTLSFEHDKSDEDSTESTTSVETTLEMPEDSQTQGS